MSQEKIIQLQVELSTLVAALCKDPSCRRAVEEGLKAVPLPTNTPVGKGRGAQGEDFDVFLAENPSAPLGDEGSICRGKDGNSVVMYVMPQAKDQRATIGQVLGKDKKTVRMTLPTMLPTTIKSKN